MDFEKETKLIDDKILESFDIVSLVSELTDEFDITIRPKDLVPGEFQLSRCNREACERACGGIKHMRQTPYYVFDTDEFAKEQP